MTFVTEAGTKRRSASRENSVCPLERSTRRATGISGGTGAGCAGTRTASATCASTGLVGAAKKVSTTRPDKAVDIVFKPAPTTDAVDAGKNQPLVKIRASL